MASTAPPPGWYPDPAQPGTQRYFDGQAWTGHQAPAGGNPPAGYGNPPAGHGNPPADHGNPPADHGNPPAGYSYPPAGYGYPMQYGPPWRGAALGRPGVGSGSLASPLQRLGAKLIDVALEIALMAVLLAIGFALVIHYHYAGSIFPPENTTSQGIPSGFWWLYGTFFAIFGFTALLFVAYDAFFTVRYGGSLGKRALHLRVLLSSGSPVGWGRAFGRAGVAFAAGIVGIVGIIDPLWCCWDENTQCLHDKAAGVIVVLD